MHKFFSRITYDFTGRRVLITGGRGLGRAIAEKFDKAGAQVIVLGRDEGRLKQLKADFPRIEVVRADLKDWDSTKLAVESALPVHHLVNNAGIPSPYPFLEIQPSQIDEVFAVNQKAVINVSQVVAKGMIQNGLENSTIVNVSSITDRVVLGAPGSAYNSTKAALTMLTKSMASELGPHRIRVNCVRPGVFASDLLNHYPSDLIHLALALYVKRVPGQHVLTAEEVADSVIFLSSEASSGVNGSSVTIDGGYEFN